MLINRIGIICRTIKYGESSLILDIFSPDVGMRSYICSGVRKKNTNKAAVMQVMNLIDFVCYDHTGTKTSLSRIKEAKLRVIYKAIPFDIVRGTLGMFLLEVTRKSTSQIDDTSSIYEFIQSKFIELDTESVALRDFHITYLIQLASALGFEMQNNYNQEQFIFSLDEGVYVKLYEQSRNYIDIDLSKALHQYLSNASVLITREDRKRLLSYLVQYYQIHIEGFGNLKSLEVLYSLYD